ncbi:MAG: 4Fe-4S dicluster domain-containing protein [Acidimicrobiales bacterium]
MALGATDVAKTGASPPRAGTAAAGTAARDNVATPRWAKVLDQSRCIGCHACTTACKSENDVPLGVSRTYVKSVDIGVFPQVRRAFQVTRCNQCDNPPCVTACPTGAMHRRSDGIVDFDKKLCIGCKACIAACPYDAIFINPEDHAAEKCNFCAQRLDIGLEPACVVVCPTEAILVGDLDDPSSKVAQMIHRQAVTVRRPEKETHPKLYYKGAHQATLDPIAARRPEGDTFMWSQIREGHEVVNSGRPGAGHSSWRGSGTRRAGWHRKAPGHGEGHGHGGNSSAAALLSYDVGHSIPWGFEVSLYTWTKGLAAGAMLVPLVLVLAGQISWQSVLLRVVGPAVAVGFLGLTGVVLIADLDRPKRFYLLFTHPQTKSWLVRGGFIIGAYGALLVAVLGAGIARSALAEQILAGPALLAALGTAVYTAYLFAQAKARDLWQTPLLAPHLIVQAVMVGAGILLPFAAGLAPGALHPLEVLVAGAAIAHLVFVFGETTVSHATAHAHLAVAEMTRGRYAVAFWLGVLLVSVGVLAPFLGWWAGIVALVGLLPHEHAYVQSGQSVALA